ncbi:AMP-dependent synthetase and ligase [Caballeronia hypogeia]|uniref:AMP-dependent synthetase and ligase n=1 Tax=Caballeronia hypogeia TaxID=1777140 RepID=A0A158A464_9BURK|nr:fatty acid--CoA ligase [Caballeronia hypogeia]SAK52612.1 AMP-dependent synthetase and ligase [Caballeronia hypogeia]
MLDPHFDSHAAPGAYAYPLLIKQLLHTPLAQAAEQEIVYRGEVRHSYRTLAERIARLANGLDALGAKHGATVAMMDWDSHRYLDCYFAVPMMGAVLQSVNVRLSQDEILYTLNHAGAQILIVHTDFIPVIDAIRTRLETVRTFIWIDEQGSPVPEHGIPFAQEYEAMLAAAQPSREFPDFDENTRATTFYTTGTTGKPKGVYFSHRQLVLHTIAGMAALASPASGQRFHRGDVYMPITPMFHVHAWGMPYIATMLGVKQVYPGRYVPRNLVRLIEQEGVTFSHCVSTILHMLLSCPDAETVDLSRWKVVIGGGALTEGLARVALGRGIDVFSGYGMSESGPLLSLAQLPPDADTLDQDEQVRLRCTTGRAIPLVDLRIVNDEMREAPRDGRTSGEIVARAPWLTQGYLLNREASAQLWEGGALHTQDIGCVDAAGYLRITDRAKDVIKSGGEWVSSLEVESLISQLPGVAEVAVIGVSDEKWGERPLALVVKKPECDTPVTEESIQRYLLGIAETGRISRYAVPRDVRFIDEISKTSVGKIDKKTLRLRFKDNQAAGA